MNVVNRNEILNISNVNAQGVLVLNDERLLSLIQQYPFLYNPRVRPFQDPDYEDWAWDNITAQFNKFYRNSMLDAIFLSEELQARWQTLKPIIKSLSKAVDVDSIPVALKQIVIKISLQLDDQTTDSKPPKVNTETQNILLHSIPIVQQMSLTTRKQMESEVLDIILNAELEAKATIKTGSHTEVDKKKFDEFVKGMWVDDMGEAFTEPLSDMESDEDIEYFEGFEEKSPPRLAGDVPELEGQENRTSEEPHFNTTLLEPLPPQRYIPLDEARFHIRKCVVRVKRFRFDDYVPLTKIKCERNW